MDLIKSFSIQILTNLSCNLDCDYCYEKKDGRINNIDSILKFIDLMVENNQDKEECIVELIGGESFLCIDLVNKITDYSRLKLKGKKLKISISSNGTTINLPGVKEYIEKNKDILNIGISIDGTKEVHDAHRKYKNGGGTYNDIIPNIQYLFKTLGKCKVGVKATFTKDSFEKYYYDSIIHLIELGFIDIAANIVYEEVVDKVFGFTVAKVLIQLADYFVDNNLYDKISFKQLIPDKDYIRNYNRGLVRDGENPDNERNYCGSCKHMTCIGFDNLIYGCNRFCTMAKENMNIGVLKDNCIKITNNQLKQDAINQYKIRPKECLSCVLRSECPSCVAAPYEGDNGVQNYLEEKRMCGWTFGASIAKFYLCVRINEQDLLKKGK